MNSGQEEKFESATKAHRIQTRMELLVAPLSAVSHEDLQVQSLQARLQKVESDRLPPFLLLDYDGKRKFTQLRGFNKVKTKFQNLFSELKELIKEESRKQQDLPQDLKLIDDQKQKLHRSKLYLSDLTKTIKSRDFLEQIRSRNQMQEQQLR